MPEHVGELSAKLVNGGLAGSYGFCGEFVLKIVLTPGDLVEPGVVKRPGFDGG